METALHLSHNGWTEEETQRLWQEIEAASQTEDGFIRLECKKTGHHRLIRASNSCKENVDCESLLSGESHITSKEDKSLHGYGIGNIRKTVEKYGGMMQISCAERVFTMELLLAK